jgi:RNA polymerase sigma factor (TIGR02999 family)
MDTPAAPPPDPTVRQALDALAAECYAQLEAIARRERRGAGAIMTLNTGTLVHEAYLRLARQRNQWPDHAHFLAAASATMRRVVIDHIRQRRAAKRGGGASAMPLDEQVGVVALREDTLIALDEALDRLGAHDVRLARVVECRYFGGLTEEEAAAALGVTARTVRRDWVKARGWLYAELRTT